MGLTSLQVCMDPADWLQGTMEDQSGLIMDSPSLSSGGGGGGGDMLAVVCSRPAAALMERHLRPPHDQALKCPRCESTHTKFCYYNNYSLTQPRYFCKTCRRYWTKGGTLRNIPVGGGCRKSKKSSSSKNNNNNKSNSSSATSSPSSSSHHNHYHHHDQLVMNHHTNNGNHFNSLLLGNHMAAAGTGSSGGGGNQMTTSIMMNNVMEPIDFLESKLEAIVGSSRNHSNYDFMGNNGGSNINDHQSLGLGGLSGNFHGMSSCSPPFGLSIDGAGGESSNNNYATVAAGMSFMETCQRLMLPYDYDHHNNNNNNNNNNVEGDDHDLKPTTAKLLSLDNTWQDYHHHHHHHHHEPAAANKETTTTGFAYLNGSWHNNGTSSTAAATTSTSTAAAVNHHHHLMMNGYNGSTITTNPLL